MKITRNLLSAVGACTLFGTITVPLAHAHQMRNQNQGVIRWTGHADKLLDVSFRRNSTWTTRISGRKGSGDAVFSSPIPRKNATVTLNQTMGRGSVWIRQQPRASNNYTCIVRISDRTSGGDNYKFTLRWAN
ncbi:MAG: hypothetical protein NTX57_12285 [Armatimonadetes bacterium]|nr:hypothetical protein [Armatimonadota bacterium]